MWLSPLLRWVGCSSSFFTRLPIRRRVLLQLWFRILSVLLTFDLFLTELNLVEEPRCS